MAEVIHAYVVIHVCFNEIAMLYRTFYSKRNLSKWFEMHSSDLVAGSSTIKRRQVPVEGPVAFYAAKSNTQANLGINQPISFKTVVVNLGNGFHSGHSLFIAPRTGVYLFASTIMTNPTSPVEVHAAITVNGNTVARIYGHGDSGRHDQGAQTVLVKLNINDEVDVTNIDREHEDVYGGLYSSFSGVLLYDL